MGYVPKDSPTKPGRKKGVGKYVPNPKGNGKKRGRYAC